MKKEINILYIGQHEEIRETVLRLIRKQEAWECSGVADVAAAIPLLASGTWDIVLLGNGVPDADEQQLRNLLPQGTRLLQHYGGGSGLLYGEIWEAMNSK